MLTCVLFRCPFISFPYCTRWLILRSQDLLLFFITVCALVFLEPSNPMIRFLFLYDCFQRLLSSLRNLYYNRMMATESQYIVVLSLKLSTEILAYTQPLIAVFWSCLRSPLPRIRNNTNVARLTPSGCVCPTTYTSNKHVPRCIYVCRLAPMPVSCPVTSVVQYCAT